MGAGVQRSETGRDLSAGSTGGVRGERTAGVGVQGPVLGAVQERQLPGEEEPARTPLPCLPVDRPSVGSLP